jgi:hypothetical protein
MLAAKINNYIGLHENGVGRHRKTPEQSIT